MVSLKCSGICRHDISSCLNKAFQANIANHLIDEFVLACGPVVEIDGSASHHSNGTSRTRRGD